MTYFWRRRIRNGLLTALVVLAFAWLFKWQRDNLQRDSFTSGYVILGCVLFLALYNFRKKMPNIPLGSSATWMQLHIYVGIGSIFIFVQHVGFRIPDGIFERTLGGLFVAVASSGVYGLYLTRTAPRKLAQLKEEVIFERIPAMRNHLAIQASDLALQSVPKTQASAIAEFYANRLHHFFVRPRSVLFHLAPSSRQRRRLMSELGHMQQYCSADEKSISEQLFSLIRQKDDLDYQYALQSKLKNWFFLHIGLTYTLIVFSLLHTVLVHAFFGGRL